MRSLLTAGVSLVAICLALDRAQAAEATVTKASPLATEPGVPAYPKDWDRRLGDDLLTRLVNYYKLEWGRDGPPPDPTAPPPRRADWPQAPATTPPYPFTEWPYGGATSIGVTRPNSVDSPLMAALSNTELGKAMNAAHVQVYGWVNVGGNLSSNSVKPGGNWPAAYMYTPNTVQLDQAVMYIERLPDTVQKDHIDWGFRISGMYGENYRYTTSLGFASYQLLGHNLVNGYDFPMVYGEVYVPFVADGLLIRAGRFISLPDIEAQLAPNNYMYSHSLAYTFDNYTNTGVQATLALNKNWMVQFGVVMGTDSAIWNYGKTVPNPFPNPVYPGPTMLKDPGNRPSVTVGLRWQSDTGNDNIYIVADAINAGNWGYNNLQWYGITWYHKFNDRLHFAWETYTLSQKNVLNVTDPMAIIANGGYPFTPANGFRFNAPNFAQCSDPNAPTCTASVIASVMYWNYKVTPLDNISLRLEYYDDQQGQRTGIKTRYSDIGLGWQHWFSPQVEIRPEITYYRSWDTSAFNGNSNANPAIAPNRNYMWLGAMDLIWHY